MTNWRNMPPEAIQAEMASQGITLKSLSHVGSQWGCTLFRGAVFGCGYSEDFQTAVEKAIKNLDTIPTRALRATCKTTPPLPIPDLEIEL